MICILGEFSSNAPYADDTYVDEQALYIESLLNKTYKETTIALSMGGDWAIPLFTAMANKAAKFQQDLAMTGEVVPSITSLGNFEGVADIIAKIGADNPCGEGYWPYIESEIRPIFNELESTEEAKIALLNIFTIGFWNLYKGEIPLALIGGIVATLNQNPPPQSEPQSPEPF